mmetsp:Transcript_47035/g.87639  ORF Transcript_47035/g.87639 Transcript_47035/m.87639 type:complete len:455 (-) Transcript_47035:93-1457(-)
MAFHGAWAALCHLRVGLGGVLAPRCLLCTALALVIMIRGQHFDTNSAHEAQNFSNVSKKVCAGRSTKCAVYIDVPFTCNTTNVTESHCPVVFALHSAGGYATDFVDTLGPFCHANKVVCLYPQSEEYGNGTGWNDGNKWGNRCAWRQFEHCPLDPNEGEFFVTIVKELRRFHFAGPLFAYGFKEGGTQALRLGANAGTYWRHLPFAGIAIGAAQLLSTPSRSGPGPYNYNRPAQIRHICYFGLHGEREKMVDGGELLDQPSGAEFVLMSFNETNEFWARYNGCTNQSSEAPVDAVWWHPASGWDKSAFWQLGSGLDASWRRHRVRSLEDSAAVAEDWSLTNATYTTWDCPPGGRVEHLIVSEMTHELPWLLRIGDEAYFERVLQFFKQCAADVSPPPVDEQASPGVSIPQGSSELPAPSLMRSAAGAHSGARLARKHATLQVEAAGMQRLERAQ